MTTVLDTATVRAPERGPRTTAMNRWLVFGLTLLSTLSAIGFVLSPVEQRVTTFDWPHGPATDSALPLFPYRATDFTATLDCQTLAAVPGGMVLGTEPRAGAAVLRPPGDGLQTVTHFVRYPEAYRRAGRQFKGGELLSQRGLERFGCGRIVLLVTGARHFEPRP